MEGFLQNSREIAQIRPRGQNVKDQTLQKG